MLRFSAIWGILTGATLGIVEVRANWADWQWWPWWLVDFVAAAMLIAGGVMTLKGAQNGKAWLIAGWAFTFGMAWMSLAGNFASGPDPDRDARLGGIYLWLVGSLVASALLGMLTALFGRAADHKT